MIRIPLKERVVLTTLGFDSILNRLDSAIVVPEDRSGQIKPYIGEINGFQFYASRLLGSKYFHLPTFFLPRIEGRIYDIPTGYEISLIAKLHPYTAVFLWICAGGLLAYTVNGILDNLVANVREFQYLEDLAIAVLVFAVLMLYFYLASRRGMRFFQVLFVQRLLGNSQIYLNTPPKSSQQVSEQVAVFSNRLRKNLPQLRSSSFTVVSSKIPDRKDSGVS
jgi:hypothetical protein